MPHVELPQAEFKVVMLGDTCTGKTSLVLRFAEGYYRDGRSATVGAFFITKRLQVNAITCKIQIWDTAGQAQFRPMAPMYYKNAAAAIVCYDVTSPQSYTVMKYWLEELHRNIPAGSIVIAVAATKTDLIGNTSETLVPTADAEELAQSMGAMFVDTSAKTNTNVTLLFRKVAERVLQFRERAKRDGVAINGSRSIPVTPGARIDSSGHVVKPSVLTNGVDSSPISRKNGRKSESRGTNKMRRDKRSRQGAAGSADDKDAPELDTVDSSELTEPKGNMCGESPMLGCGILPTGKEKNGEEGNCIVS